MRVKITKSQLQKLLVTRTVLTLLEQFTKLLSDIVLEKDIDGEKISKQSRIIIKKIAEHIDLEIHDHYSLYQSLVVPIAEENSYTLTNDTTLKIDLENDEIVLEEPEQEDTEVVN